MASEQGIRIRVVAGSDTQVNPGRLLTVRRALRALAPDALSVSSHMLLAPSVHDVLNAEPRGWLQFAAALDARFDLSGWDRARVMPSSGSRVQLGSRDADRREWTASFSGYPTSPRGEHLLSVRTIDTLFAGERTRLGCVLIAESSSRALDILRGCEEALRHHRPAVAVHLDSTIAASAVRDLFSTRHYVPIASTRAGYRGTCLPQGWQVFVHQRRAGVERMWLDAESSETEGYTVLCSALPRWGFLMPDEEAPGVGTAPCWIGPRPRAGLAIPAPDGPVGSVLLGIDASVSDRNIREAVVLMDGKQAASRAREMPEGGHAIEIVPATGSPWMPIHTLEISVPESMPHGRTGVRRAMAIRTLRLVYARR